MKVFNLSNQGATYVNENPHSENLILKVTGLVCMAAVAITAMIVAGGWGVLAVSGISLITIVLKVSV